MAQGMQFFAGNGNLTYSSSDVTWNQVDFFEMAAGDSYVVHYPVIAGRQVLIQQMFINPPPTDRKATAHTVTIEGTRVAISGGSEAVYILVLMR